MASLFGHFNKRTDSAVTPDNKSVTKSPFLQPKKVFNPFNQNLKERLENPIFSPNVFSTVISPSQDSAEFKWTIEDLSRINPAPIEEEFHYEEHVDEQTEKEIQSTIDRYFTKTHVVHSPWDCKLPTDWSELKKAIKTDEEPDGGIEASSPYFPISQLDTLDSSFHDVSTQTVLSLPPDLPESVNNALQPYIAQNIGNGNAEDVNLSLNSLRRKLFFHADNESPSPIRFCDSSPSVKNCCPSTPLLKGSRCDSPMRIFSPIDISPIKRISDNARGNSNNAMNLDTPTSELRVCKLSIQESVDRTPKTRHFQEECIQVFESPRVTCGIRRARKRRRSLSQDITMSVSHSYITNPNRNETTKRSFFGESRMSIDNSNKIPSESQDTGYQTESVNLYTFGAEKNFSSNESDVKPVECWKMQVENYLVASTPTK